MESATTKNEPAWHQYEQERNRNLRRNYWANIIEGGIYMGGMTLLSGETVMPAMVNTLGGPEWLIALTPSLAMIGFMLPPLFMAHHVERMVRVKPFAAAMGILQRLPFLIAGLSLLYFGDVNPTLALTFVVAAPLLAGLAGGIGMSAWFELVCRVIPEHRRASSWGMRFLLQGAAGLGAGLVIEAVLRRYPGTDGFGILMLLTFAALCLSYLIFLQIREVQPPDAGKHHSAANLRDNLVNMLGILRTDRVFQPLLWSRLLSMGYLIPAPFFGLHALRVTGQPEAWLGHLVILQMVGGVIANAVGSLLGDRFGGKMLIVASRFSMLAVCVLLPLAGSKLAFEVLFFVYGLGFAMQHVGFTTVFSKIIPSDSRPSYVGLQAGLTLPATLLAAGIGGVLMQMFGNVLWPSLAALVFLAFSTVLLVRVREMRSGNAG